MLAESTQKRRNEVRKNKRKPTVKRKQQDLLADLRKRFASCGHLILKVSRLRRHHLFDFLAVPKDNPQKFLIVEPMHNGRVRVRPFCCDSLYYQEKKVIEEARKVHGKKVTWYDQIPLSRLKLGLEHYVTPTGSKELQRIIGLELQQKPRSL